MMMGIWLGPGGAVFGYGKLIGVRWPLLFPAQGAGGEMVFGFFFLVRSFELEAESAVMGHR